MKKCWAFTLENCDSKITGEHLISKNIFDKKAKIKFEGLLKNKVFTVSRENFKSNILCYSHNSYLSKKIDPEGGKNFNAISQIDGILAKVKKTDLAKKFRIEINGEYLEKWFAKTAINFFYTYTKNQVWYNGSENCPLEILNWIFRGEKLTRPKGLYNYVGKSIGERIQTNGDIYVTLLFDKKNKFSGAHFHLNGLTYLIWFSNKVVNPKNIKSETNTFKINIFDKNLKNYIEYFNIEGNKSMVSKIPTDINSFYHHQGGEFVNHKVRIMFGLIW